MDQIPVEFTEVALNEIQSIFQTKNIESDYCIRIGIRGGGCSGISYAFGLDKKNEGDLLYTIQNIPVVIEKKHMMYVAGMKIDFINTAEERGFVLENPNTMFT